MQIPGGDALIKAMLPAVEQMVRPMLLQARAGLLGELAGPAPAGFAARVRTMFGFDDAQVNALWAAAIDTAADLKAERESAPALTAAP